MANMTELQLQGDSTVYKLNDARVTTTSVTTATHILTTNSGVTSIAPITAANLASVLGATKTAKDLDIISLNNGTYAVYSTTTGAPVTPLSGDIVVVFIWNIETKSFIYFTSSKKIYVGYKLYNENSITWKQLSYAAP